MELFIRKNITILFIGVSILFSHPTVKDLNIKKFMGRWYVISLIPNWIEEGGTDSYDDYLLNEDGTIDITYRAIKNGEEKTIKQKGFIVDENIPSKWEIQFVKPWIPFYRAPYEIIILDDNYEYMVVGYPDNTYGWIMSRSTSISNKIYNKIVTQLDEEFGYSKKDFIKVIHNN